MPSSYTSNLRLELPVTGELANTWGERVNDGITTLVDQAITGRTAIVVADANVTLTSSNGATDQARSMFLDVSGTATTTRDIIVPSVSKMYIVANTVTGQSIRVIAAGTGVTVPTGFVAFLQCDGTDVKSALNWLTSPTLVTPSFSTITNTGTLTLPTTTDTLVGRATTDTLTNKTLTTPVLSAVASGTTTGRLGFSAGALTYGTGSVQRTVVNLDEAQTLTNKTLTSPTISGQTATGSSLFLASATTTQDGVILTGRAGGASSFRVTVTPTTLTASRAVTFPDAAGAVVLDTATQTLTNKTISGAITTIGLTMATARLLGRTTASTGAIEEITVGTGLSLSAGTLSAAGTALSALTAATTSSTLANGNNPIVWNWAQTTGAQTAFSFGETSAATGGAGGQYLVEINTQSGSTAAPFRVRAQNRAVISVASDGALALNGASANGGGKSTTISTGSALTAGDGGALTLATAGGFGGGAGDGGAISITSGSGGLTGASGAVTIASGSAGGGSNNGTGSITIQTGIPTGTGATGTVTILAQNTANTGSSPNVTITAGANTSATGAGGGVSISAGSTSGSGAGGDVTLQPGTSASGTAGRVRFNNSSTANGTVATTLGSVGPTGANTTVQGWLTIKIAGTVRYIPYW